MLLALGAFALGMDAFIVAGLIPDINAETLAGEAAVGQMVTVFTLCYAVSGPLLSSLLKANTKTLLLAALAVFTAGNIATVLSESLPALLLSRGIAGTGAGLYSPIAATAAVQLATPARRGRALSLILGGLSLGTVAGVPAGLLVAQHYSWRAAFWMVAVVGVLAALGIARVMPRLDAGTLPGPKARLSTLVDPRVTPIVLVSVLFNVASLGLYTYIAPVLRATSGITNPTIYLALWGLGGIIGAFGVGPLLDRVPRATRVMPVVLGLFIIATAVIAPAGQATAVVAVALACWGAAGFASPPPQQHLLLARAPDRGAVALAMNASAIYLGSALGSALGGIALSMGLPASALPASAAGVAAVAAIAYFALVIPERPGRGTRVWRTQVRS